MSDRNKKLRKDKQRTGRLAHKPKTEKSAKKKDPRTKSKGRQFGKAGDKNKSSKELKDVSKPQPRKESRNKLEKLKAVKAKERGNEPAKERRGNQPAKSSGNEVKKSVKSVVCTGMNVKESVNYAVNKACRDAIGGALQEAKMDAIRQAVAQALRAAQKTNPEVCDEAGNPKDCSIRVRELSPRPGKKGALPRLRVTVEPKSDQGVFRQ